MHVVQSVRSQVMLGSYLHGLPGFPLSVSSGGCVGFGVVMGVPLCGVCGVWGVKSFRDRCSVWRCFG